MARPLVLLAPGAGAPSSSRWMSAWAERLGDVGDVVRFDYPYMRAGRRTPDRLPVLVEAHREALADARRGRHGPVILAGKSMGSRVACHVALEAPVDALVCLGYPLRGARGDLRSEVLFALRTPILFVQGTRDPLCPLDALEDVRRRMSAPSTLYRVEGGNHSLEVSARALRAAGEGQAEVDARTLGAVVAFLRGALERRPPPSDAGTRGGRAVSGVVRRPSAPPRTRPRPRASRPTRT